ncbi:hypothetical protein ACIBCR_16260 [Micromonospora echinospora]|uniref:hypothetical protein n=1 Tax=Micromonospora echinospora TaxID=1877 RepID=UPI003794BF7F
MSITATLGTLGTIGAMAATVEDLERRLAAGEWLRPGDVARLLRASKSTVVRMLDADPPQIRYRLKPGTGRHRECHPGDVRRHLEERRRVHGDQ